MYVFRKLLYNRLPREVNSKAENGLETMWTRRRLHGQVDNSFFADFSSMRTALIVSE